MATYVYIYIHMCTCIGSSAKTLDEPKLINPSSCLSDPVIALAEKDNKKEQHTTLVEQRSLEASRTNRS